MLHDPLCNAHGWMSHVFVHEAAHAVAAIDRSIEFSHIEVLTPAQWTQDHPDGAAVGGLHLAPPPSLWVLPDPVKALEMVLAGFLAEEGVYQHHISEGYRGDLRIWRLGAGLANGQTKTSIEEVLGCSMADLLASTRTWLVEAFPRIRRVAVALAGADENSVLAVIDYGTGPWSMTYDEVRALIS